ncbi:cobalamin B12-binding domain-containing protein [Ectothiorhodospira shaposhnikovii]|uniref:cobalamin B12-binding domain-containing protein n=1 Tax=Ectothiorhodospira shaposhnikovii TaxID=1054 RepID=UPI001904B20E|nr:cobalamin-dependent protein [Ectothiorhodospira shaposhnikovii]
MARTATGCSVHSGRFRLDEEGVRQFEYHREELIRFSSHRITARFPEIYVDGGAFGSDRCREELTFLLEFIRPALVFGILEPLEDCLRWLSALLQRRGLSTEAVLYALEEMKICLSRYLYGENRQCMTDLLNHAAMILCEDNGGTFEDEAIVLEPAAGKMMQALIRGDRSTVCMLIEEALSEGNSLMEAERRLLQPALYQVGHEWHANRLSVAREHLATTTAQDAMAQLLFKQPPSLGNGRRALFAAPPGNRHVLGLRMIADAFEMAGWSVQFLGADVPLESLLGQIQDFDPHLVGLTASLPQHLWPVRSLVEEIRGHQTGTYPLILVGGMLINRVPSLALAIGADLWAADACDAVRLVDECMISDYLPPDC